MYESTTRLWRAYRRPREANADKRDAEYKVAIENCDEVAGPVKKRCVRVGKGQYGIWPTLPADTKAVERGKTVPA